MNVFLLSLVTMYTVFLKLWQLPTFVPVFFDVVFVFLWFFIFTFEAFFEACQWNTKIFFVGKVFYSRMIGHEIFYIFCLFLKKEQILNQLAPDIINNSILVVDLFNNYKRVKSIFLLLIHSLHTKCWVRLKTSYKLKFFLLIEKIIQVPVPANLFCASGKQKQRVFFFLPAIT